PRPATPPRAGVGPPRARFRKFAASPPRLPHHTFEAAPEGRPADGMVGRRDVGAPRPQKREGEGSMSTAEQVLEVLAEVAEVDEVYRDPDLRLYDLHILDSMSTVQLLIALSERLGVELSP